jgi:sporulation protein YlmC with PRC-barrel domain
MAQARTEKPERFYLAARLLDRQLTDTHGVRCGKVDDVDFRGRVGEELVVVALLVGPQALLRRLPPRLQSLLSPLRRLGASRIPWNQVETLTNDELRLRGTARELGLDRYEEAAARQVSKVPLA